MERTSERILSKCTNWPSCVRMSRKSTLQTAAKCILVPFHVRRTKSNQFLKTGNFDFFVCFCGEFLNFVISDIRAFGMHKAMQRAKVHTSSNCRVSMCVVRPWPMRTSVSHSKRFIQSVNEHEWMKQ